MKRIFCNALMAAALAVASVACTDLSDLEQRMDNLESQVAALETQVKALNSNVDATLALMQAGTINKVENKGDVWTLTMSDGTVVTLNQGSVGVGNAPVMSIDAEGYWMVDYGTGKEYVLNGGQKVKATGADGVTPKFGVNAAGNWTVSYDGGATYVEVPGADGKPVSALPGESGSVSDPYFSAVTYEGGVFTLVLKDGTALTVPVVADFLCSISGADAVQFFTSGATRTFDVTLKGVAETVVSAPAGWTASLEGALLSVTAPAATKAVLADTRTDVSVLALSGSGYATVAKLRVRVDDSGVTVNPVATLAVSDSSETSISFTVALSDADAWKYVVLKSGETAPTAEYMQASATAGEGTGATVTGLESACAYTVYVLPLNGTTAGAVVSVSVSTKSINDWYTAYNNGMSVEIAGVKYSKAANGDAVLLTAAEAATDLKASINNKSGVFFLEEAAGAYFDAPTITEISGDVVLVSRYADKPVTIRPTMCMKLKKGSLVMKNIIYDLVNINGGSNATYAFNNANAEADFSRLHFDGCRFINVTRPILYCSKADNGFVSIKMLGSTVQYKHTSGNVVMFNLYNSKSLHLYKELVFEDNVVYNAQCAAIQVFQYNQNTAQSGTVWEGVMSMSRNIFYNCPSGNGYCKFYNLASLKMNGNVFWADPAGTVASYGFILYDAAQNASAVDATGNIAYGLADGKNWLLAHSNSTVKPADNTLPKLDADPFESFDSATGSYVLKPAYATYGPRK